MLHEMFPGICCAVYIAPRNGTNVTVIERESGSLFKHCNFVDDIGDYYRRAGAGFLPNGVATIETPDSTQSQINGLVRIPNGGTAEIRGPSGTIVTIEDHRGRRGAMYRLDSFPERRFHHLGHLVGVGGYEDSIGDVPANDPVFAHEFEDFRIWYEPV